MIKISFIVTFVAFQLCQAKKDVINSRIDFMEYTIEQYQLGLIQFSSVESGLSQSQYESTHSTGSIADAGDLSQSDDIEERHVGPFNRTPLLSKINDKTLRTDGAENGEVSIDYMYNKTIGSYVIFHRTDDRDGENIDNSHSSESGTDYTDNSSSSLVLNKFELSISLETVAQSNAPSTTSNPNCPSPYNPSKVDYNSTSFVEFDGFIFKCNDEPYTEYCNYPAFDEVLIFQAEIDIDELTDLWLNAWELVGQCRITGRPTLLPTRKPTSKPVLLSQKPNAISESPTIEPSFSPTVAPTWSPTSTPTDEFIESSNGHVIKPKTNKPTKKPSSQPSNYPAATLTQQPAKEPSFSPTVTPSWSPTVSPIIEPPKNPFPPITNEPSDKQNLKPVSIEPSNYPTGSPLSSPSISPTNILTKSPTLGPVTKEPSQSPSYGPSGSPVTVKPTKSPQSQAIDIGITAPPRPTNKPTVVVLAPTRKPSKIPSVKPTPSPTKEIIITAPPKPTNKPNTISPTKSPSKAPTTSPSFTPSQLPSFIPSTSTMPSQNPTEAPTYSPSTFEPTSYNDPIPPKCSKSETRIRIELMTDDFPRDTSWLFKRLRERNGRNGAMLLRSQGYTRASPGDIREICLDEGRYEFIIRDKYRDGLCCDHGSGYYKISAKRRTDNDWKLIVAGAQFTANEVVHTFVIRDNGKFELVCEHPQRKITIEIMTDNFGEDTSWQFRDQNGVVVAKNERVYERKEADSRDLCIDDKALYEFVVFDTYGDGICCRFGEGYYKILTYNDALFKEEVASSNGVAILHGGLFYESSITHIINTTTALMSDRDLAWLESHNARRKKYHTEYEQDYVPLQWSDGLKAEAKIWADTLLDACGKGMYHDPQRIYGENAAGNSGGGSWGTKREPDKILTRFVEYELDDPWPHNGHLTQVLWRASRYVGCAESHKVLEGGRDRQCHTQVCRYAVTGNCNMGRFQTTNSKNKTVVDWLTPTLEETNFCGPLCPPDGCHA